MDQLKEVITIHISNNEGLTIGLSLMIQECQNLKLKIFLERHLEEEAEKMKEDMKYLEMHISLSMRESILYL